MSDITFDDAALKAMLTSPTGELARYLGRVGVAVESAAKVNASGAPHFKPPGPRGRDRGRAWRPSRSDGGEGPGVRSSRLRDSITWNVARDSHGLYVDIGSNVEYAPWVELGHSVVSGGWFHNRARIRTRAGGFGSNVGKAPPYPFLRPALAAIHAVR